MTKLSLVTLIVRDYDEAANWFEAALGFRKTEDAPVGGKRWVVVEAPDGGRLLLARAEGPRQIERVGDQFAGRVGLFLETSDFDEQARRMAEAGVSFEETPRNEPYGKVAVFRDLYGNRWDLIEPADR